MKIKTGTALAVLCLAAHSEAFNFGRLLGTANKAIGGVNILLGQILNNFRNDGVVCPEHQFKAKAVTTSSLCQLVEDFDAMEACQSFGSSCVSIPGRWGCGYIDTDFGKERGCLFQPRRVPVGKHFPKIHFDFDDEYRNEYYNDGESCIFGRKRPAIANTPFDTTVAADDEIPSDYKDPSDFFAKTTTYDLKRYSDIFKATEETGKKSSEVLASVIKALELAGIRFPIGRNTCSFCKGVCNKLFSGDKLDICKYGACVRFLGGYKGDEGAPSCALVAMP